MKITAELVQEMHEARYDREHYAVIAEDDAGYYHVVPEVTAKEKGWFVITDTRYFEDWLGGWPLEPGDYQEYADALNRDLGLM